MRCQPEIKSLHSPDVIDLETWEPEHEHDVFVLIQLAIGPQDNDSADVFQVVVSTPEGLRMQDKPDTIVIEDRALLVVKNFVWPEISRHLHSVVASCQGDSWFETSQKLQRYFHWEYDDYTDEVSN